MDQKIDKKLKRIPTEKCSKKKLFQSVISEEENHFDRLKTLSSPSLKTVNNRYLVLIDGTFQVLTVMNSDLKKIFARYHKESVDEEDRQVGSLRTDKLKIDRLINSLNLKSRVTKIDKQLALYVANKIPLTNTAVKIQNKYKLPLKMSISVIPIKLIIVTTANEYRKIGLGMPFW